MTIKVYNEIKDNWEILVQIRDKLHELLDDSTDKKDFDSIVLMLALDSIL